MMLLALIVGAASPALAESVPESDRANALFDVPAYPQPSQPEAKVWETSIPDVPARCEVWMLVFGHYPIVVIHCPPTGGRK